MMSEEQVRDELIEALRANIELMKRVERLEAELAASRAQCRKQMEYPAREDLKRKVLDVLRRFEQARPGHPVEQQVAAALAWYEGECDALRALASGDSPRRHGGTEARRRKLEHHD